MRRVHRITEVASGSPDATPSPNGSAASATVEGGATVVAGGSEAVVAVVSGARVVLGAPSVGAGPAPSGSPVSSPLEQAPTTTAADSARKDRRESVPMSASLAGDPTSARQWSGAYGGGMAELSRQMYGDPDGPRVVAIHGVTGHGRRFEALANGPWAHRRVLAVDLRGHGFSTGEAPWNFEQHVADVLDTLDAVGWAEPVDVVGHSFGGAVATFLMALAPGRVRRTVLLDPALHLPGDVALANARDALAFPGFDTREAARRAREAILDPAGHGFIDAELDQHLLQEGDGRFRYRFELAPIAAAWGEMARTTPRFSQRRPTLVVVATKADVYRASYAAALQAELGGALTRADLDCGHMVYWERFDETAALVESFLAAEVPGR